MTVIAYGNKDPVGISWHGDFTGVLFDNFPDGPPYYRDPATGIVVFVIPFHGRFTWGFADFTFATPLGTIQCHSGQRTLAGDYPPVVPGMNSFGFCEQVFLTGVAGATPGSDTQWIVQNWAGPVFPGISLSDDIGATPSSWSMSTTAEIAHIPQGPPDPDNPFPAFGGVATLDPPEELEWRSVWLVKKDTEIVVTCTFGHATKTLTWNANAAFIIEPEECDVDGFERGLVNCDTSQTVSNTVSCTVIHSVGTVDQSLGAPYDHVDSPLRHEIDATSGLSVFCAVLAGDDFNDVTAELRADLWPKKEYTAEFRVRRMGEDFLSVVALAGETKGVWDPIDAVVKAVIEYFPTDANGQATLTRTQEQYYCVGTFYTNFIGGTRSDTAVAALYVNEYWPIKFWIRPGSAGDGVTGSLLDLGQNQRLWRIMGRGPWRNAMELVQHDHEDIDAAPSTTNWTAGAHTTLSNASGLHAVIAGGVGNFSRTFAAYSSIVPGVGMGGYRYLSFTFVADATVAFSVTIRGKVWTKDRAGVDLKATTTPTAYVIDLLNPTNHASETDMFHTKWPFPTVDSELYGVSWCDVLTIGALEDGHNYTLTLVKLVCADHRRLAYCMPVWVAGDGAGWQLKIPPVSGGGTTTTTEARRGGLCLTDGRQSWEWDDYDRLTVVSSAGTIISYVPNPIQAVVAGFNGANEPSVGFVANDLAAAPVSDCPDTDGYYPIECWLNSDQAATFLEGGGAAYYNGAWRYQTWHTTIESFYTIRMQALFDTLDFPPMAGDLFLLGDTPDADRKAILKFATILDGSSGGIVCNGAAPANAIPVSLALAGSPSSDYGDALTDTQGVYYATVSGSPVSPLVAGTGQPYGLGGQAYDTVAQVGSMPYPRPSRTFFTRYLHNCSVARITGGGGPPPPPVLNPLFMMRDYTHRLMIYGTDGDGHLIVFLYDDNDANPVPVTIDSNVDCSRPSFYLRDVVIHGVYLRGTSPYMAKSQTHGRTWTLTSIPGAYDALTHVEHKGRAVLLGYKSSTLDWYVRVGVPDDSGAYTWSSEVALGLTDANGVGAITARWDGVLELVWQDGSNVTWMTRGRGVGNDGTGTWVTSFTLPGTYDNVTYTGHKGRTMMLGYKASVPDWYVRMGVTDDSETFTWSSEVALGLVDANGIGHTMARWDGVLEFVFQDSTLTTYIIRGRGVGNDGVGIWS